MLEQSGLEALNWWWRLSTRAGWGRMLKKLLPRALEHVRGADFTPGAVTRRDYGIKTVPEGFAK